MRRWPHAQSTALRPRVRIQPTSDSRKALTWLPRGHEEKQRRRPDRREARLLAERKSATRVLAANPVGWASAQRCCSRGRAGTRGIAALETSAPGQLASRDSVVGRACSVAIGSRELRGLTDRESTPVSDMRFVLRRRSADAFQDSCTRLLVSRAPRGAPPGYFSPRKRVTKVVGPRAERARRRALSGHPAGRSSIVGAGGELSASIA